MRLTKKRLAALSSALSLDDILYEKFRRLNEQLQREQRRIYKAKRIVQVRQKQGKNYVILRILDVQVTSEGTLIVCQ